jgi:AcrR family transcriptional regulator
MDLFEEQGFDQTTVAKIASRAGLTERTFFRHFADKREVLFGGAPDLPRLLADQVSAAPGSLGALEAAERSLTALGALLDERRGREFARRRQAILARNPELQERELIKMVTWSESLTEALRQRGVPALDASLVGEVAVATFRVAFHTWVGSRRPRRLTQLIEECFDGLRDLAAGQPAPDLSL